MVNNRNNLLMISWLLGLLLFVAGCPQGEDPAEAMAKRYNETHSQSSTSDNATTPATKSGAQDAALNPADAAANPCGEAAVEEEYTGPAVTITIESVDNHIPEYDGKAKYDIKLEVMSDEVPATPGVWEIKAFDEAGELVGESKKHLTIPSSYPKILVLSGFYCSSAPVSFQIRRTAGKAISVEDAQAAAGEADKSGGGGGMGRGGAGGSGGSGDGGGDGGGDDEDDPIGDE